MPSLKSIVRRRLSHCIDAYQDFILPSANDRERQLAQALRDRVKDLPAIPVSQPGTTDFAWNENLRELRHMIAAKDPRNFLGWEVVQQTMFHYARPDELHYLKALPNWEAYAAGLLESRVGRPPRYTPLPHSSANLVHHAYNYAQFREFCNFDLPSLNHVFEFGGGYGSFARFLFQMGFAGHYTIFDLPEFSALQNYFLSSLASVKITTSHGSCGAANYAVSLVENPSILVQHLSSRPIQLFVATWSLSETPLSVRQPIEAAVGSPDHFLIAFQANFGEVDNIKYFARFVRDRPQYEWSQRAIPHLRGDNFYLFGRRR